ncbi:MAG: DUF4139 domain-containing protein [bacterium]
MSLAIVGTLLLGLVVPATAAVVESTVADQQSVAITVYNDGTGLVRDLRTVMLPLPAQAATLVWRDVASGIVTQSVSLLDAQPDTALWSVLEQNYRYDLIDQSKLIAKYLGKTVGIAMYDPSLDKTIVKSGTLLSPDVIEIEGKIYPGIPGQLILPQLPEGLISVPTLEWELNSPVSSERLVSLSYLTSGMSWQADYVAVVNADDTALDLNGWTTITNNSGTAYHNAMLKLVAGDVHRVPVAAPVLYPDMVRKSDMAYPATVEQLGFEEKSFFEYHLYTLGRPATLLNNEQKQIALFDPAHTPALKKFIADGSSHYWGGDDSQKIDVQVKLEFENKEARGLGMPLPKGTVRVYKADTDGSLQFIGEDHIEHTPKDETVRLLLGNAFDIKCDRIVAARRQIGTDIWEYDITVKLRNHKPEPVIVTVVDHVDWGDWSVTKQAGGVYHKKDASTLEFDVTCAPDVEQVLTYTIRREY